MEPIPTFDMTKDSALRGIKQLQKDSSLTFDERGKLLRSAAICRGRREYFRHWPNHLETLQKIYQKFPRIKKGLTPTMVEIEVCRARTSDLAQI